MLQEVRDVLYVDSQGREAYASELLGSKYTEGFTMFKYRKRLKFGSKGDDGVAYICMPNKIHLGFIVLPADSEDGAKCELLSTLSIEIGKVEYQLECLKKFKEQLSEELR